MVHVEIDLHTRNMVNVAINDNGDVVRRAKLSTSPKALDDFFGGFKEPIQAVVECTGNWYRLSDWYRANNIPLMLAHAKMVKAISYAKVKTDTVDAKTLAELLRAGLIPGGLSNKTRTTSTVRAHAGTSAYDPGRGKLLLRSLQFFEGSAANQNFVLPF